MHSGGKLKAGEVRGGKEGRVRGDLMKWVSTQEAGPGLKSFMQVVDKFVMAMTKEVSELRRNERLMMRTDAMATVYPGDGTHYVRHIDNNSANGRVITTILYLNPIWEASDGGQLKLFLKRGEVMIEPVFNRFCVFWSDNRCPHEVSPA